MPSFRRSRLRERCASWSWKTTAMPLICWRNFCGSPATPSPSPTPAARAWRPQERRPPMSLCDIGLPDGDGYTLAQALRENPQTASAQLIAVTARNREEDKQRSREAGFQLHLVKPVRPESLLRELDKAARKFTPGAR